MCLKTKNKELRLKLSVPVIFGQNLGLNFYHSHRYLLCEPLSLRASSPFEGHCKKSRASSTRELGWLCLAVHSRALSQIASRATRDEESFLSSFPDLNLCATYDIYNNVF